MPDKHKVVILGGGFAGLYAAQALKRAPLDITFIDRRNYHLFQPSALSSRHGFALPGRNRSADSRRFERTEEH